VTRPPAGSVRPGLSEAVRADLTDVGPVEDFPVGRLVMIEFEGRTVGIIRTKGGLRAIGNRCPHQGGPLCRGIVTGTMAPSAPNEYVYEQDGEIIRCPWHGYEFELSTGRSVGGAIRGRVQIYTVEARAGRVYFALRRADRPEAR
jgi:3-phenylpropionate/trans-cinnamate dioxygenase ferredoxin subunit